MVRPTSTVYHLCQVFFAFATVSLKLFQEIAFIIFERHLFPEKTCVCQFTPSWCHILMPPSGTVLCLSNGLGFFILKDALILPDCICTFIVACRFWCLNSTCKYVFFYSWLLLNTHMHSCTLRIFFFLIPRWILFSKSLRLLCRDVTPFLWGLGPHFLSDHVGRQLEAPASLCPEAKDRSLEKTCDLSETAPLSSAQGNPPYLPFHFLSSQSENRKWKILEISRETTSI
jgi:hypothetical protein